MKIYNIDNKYVQMYKHCTKYRPTTYYESTYNFKMDAIATRDGQCCKVFAYFNNFLEEYNKLSSFMFIAEQNCAELLLFKCFLLSTRKTFKVADKYMPTFCELNVTDKRMYIFDGCSCRFDINDEYTEDESIFDDILPDYLESYVRTGYNQLFSSVMEASKQEGNEVQQSEDFVINANNTVKFVTNDDETKSIDCCVLSNGNFKNAISAKTDPAINLQATLSNEKQSKTRTLCNEQETKDKPDMQLNLNSKPETSLKLNGKLGQTLESDTISRNKKLNTGNCKDVGFTNCEEVNTTLSIPKTKQPAFDLHSIYDFIHKILNYENYLKLDKRGNGKLLKNFSSNIPLRHTCMTYKSAEDYKETYGNLLYIETLKGISQMCVKSDQTWIHSYLCEEDQASVILDKRFSKACLTYHVTVKSFNEEEFPVIWSLICIKFRRKFSFAVVQSMTANPKLEYGKRHKDKPRKIISKLKLTVIMINSIFPHWSNKVSPIEIRFICRLSGPIKMYSSLFSLEKSPFHKFLLNPKIDRDVIKPKINRDILKPKIDRDVLKPKIDRDVVMPVVGKQLLLNVNLNKEQKKAVLTISEEVLTDKVVIKMIHGPPGTGKTQTISALVGQLLLLFEKHPAKRNPIMVCAPSNAAADELALRIVKLRKIDKSLESLKLTRIGIINKIKKEVVPFCLDESLPLNEKKSILKESDVIVSTVVSSFCSLTSEISFSCCIIDECGHCHEPEALVPLLLCFTKIVLIGDQNQLSATVLCNRALAYGLQLSMFERFYNYARTKGTLSGIHRLKVQYRMHKSIASWPSTYFYNSSLITPHKITEERSYKIRPYMLFDLKFSEETKIDSSFCNIMECYFIKTLCDLLKPYIEGLTVGIITPYTLQKEALISILGNRSKLIISTVDMFQGQERDVIIVSFVRANYLRDIGFLKDKCRLNVSLTRARRSCFIVGNLNTLYNNETLMSLTNNAFKRKLICPISSNCDSRCKRTKLLQLLRQTIFTSVE